jgi:long-subunit acyl-CoA synthetase (AMP-forming)
MDHFEPDVSDDPQAQKRLRGQLEHIDYTAFASNREVIAQSLGHADAAKFQRMAIAAALARARWVSAALAASGTQPLTAEQTAQLTQLRSAYEELAEAYEALRRMVERGYLSFRGPDPKK